MNESTSIPDDGHVRPLKPRRTRRGDRPLESGDQTATPPARPKDSVIELREGGRSYAAIARLLTMPNGVQAQAAFLTALRQKPERERTSLVRSELDRLEILEKKIRARTDDDPVRTRQRLVALEKLRSALHSPTRPAKRTSATVRVSHLTAVRERVVAPGPPPVRASDETSWTRG